MNKIITRKMHTLKRTSFITSKVVSVDHFYAASQEELETKVVNLQAITPDYNSCGCCLEVVSTEDHYELD